MEKRKVYPCEKESHRISFGRYGEEHTTIVWKVLKQEANKSLLIAEQGIDSKKYNNERCTVAWETCSLR